MSTPTLTHNLAAPINGLTWLDETLAAITGEGTLHLLRPTLEKPAAINVSQSPLLALVATPEGFATADESGNIHLTTPQGETRLLAATRYPFLEHLAYFPKKKQLLAATGKTITIINLRDTKHETRNTTLPHPLPSTISGLAISPIGPRVAASHYGGATILALDSPKNPPRTLPWKGSHLHLTYSPDGKWLISAMQEQAIHLWRLSDGLDLQMRGYPAKITQFSWDTTGTRLATNGGGGVPVWDFSKYEGPAGTQARVIADSGTQNVLVTSVQMHPKGPFCAIGYSDGLVLLSNITDENSVLLHKPNNSPATHLAWSPTGLHIAMAHAGGALTLTDFTTLV